MTELREEINEGIKRYDTAIQKLDTQGRQIEDLQSAVTQLRHQVQSLVAEQGYAKPSEAGWHEAVTIWLIAVSIWVVYRV